MRNDFKIDTSQDFTPTIQVDRQVVETGAYEPYAGIAGVTLHLSAAEAGLPIDDSLVQTAAERVGRPGAIWASFDVDDLQLHVRDLYNRKVIFLVMTKEDEIQGKSFRCLVTRNGK